MRIAYLLMIILLMQVRPIYAQAVAAAGAPDSTGGSLQQLPGKYFSQVSGKSHRFEKQVNKCSQKALERLARQEKKMQARLARIDSAAARNIFSRSIDSVGSLQSRLKQKAGNNIRFSHQGVGLRSFLDWKLKVTFYVNGGFEQNYNAAFTNTDRLRNIDNWQRSALIGRYQQEVQSKQQAEREYYPAVRFFV